MQWEGYYDPEEIKRAVKTLQAPGKVFEVRVVGGSRKEILSGYFRDADTLIKKLETIDVRGRNMYITLGQVKPECFAREQSERFVRNPATTSDPEILAYRWLFVDFDPVRPAGISSSEQEIKTAEELAEKVGAYMADMGFPEPVRAMSGNGFHLLYRIDLPNDAESRALVERCLKNLSSMFDTNAVKIDTTNSNPSRICKLHGTLAQKGTSTAERPHRMSRLLSVPAEVQVAPREVVETLANELPDDTPQTNSRRGGRKQTEEFDLLDFLRRNGITYSEDANDRARIYKLDECPFDHNHRRGDAKIFQYSNGAIAFKCHHNSCRQYKWQDVRLKFEPDAYDHEDEDARIDEGYKKHKAKQAEEEAAGPVPTSEEKPKKPKKKKTPRKLKTAEGLMAKNIPEPKVFIGVGAELPLLVEGTCILSAKPKLGKSWLALGMCLAVADGRDFLGYRTKQCSTLYLDLETSEALQQKRLKKMLKGEDPPKKFYIDTETDNIDDGFVDQIESYLTQDPDIGIVVIDVFQIIRTPAKGIKETEYEHAYRDITPLNELAQKHHISIILVCHDRKAVDPDDPFSNILGSTGLQGAATQMMVMFKKRKDDPIHISVKGKTIDGLPDLNVKLEDAVWSVVEGNTAEERRQAEECAEFVSSNIRRAVCAIADREPGQEWQCGGILNTATKYGIPIIEDKFSIGRFLGRHQGRFLAEDGVQVTIIKNGSGARKYRIDKATVDTVDENTWYTVDDAEKSISTRVPEDLFP